MNKKPRVYLRSLTIEGVRCFGARQELDLTWDDRIAQWSLVVGENGNGKTTLLECLSWMSPVFWRPDIRGAEASGNDSDINEDEGIKPALSTAENDAYVALGRSSAREAKLSAQLLCGDVDLYRGSTANYGEERGHPISLQMGLSFDEEGALSGTEEALPIRVADIPEGFEEPLVVAYGANRQPGEGNAAQFVNDDPKDHRRLSLGTDLCDVGELLMTLDYAARVDEHGEEAKALARLKAAISRVLPHEPTAEISIYPPDILGTGRRGGVYAETFSCPVPLSQLSLGYRSTAGWIVDFAWRLSRHYPNSLTPMEEPAIVLIDELDLHLHPRWQLNIMKDIGDLFPATQFIATTHSPLVVQVAEEANLVLLERDEKQIRINNDPSSPTDPRDLRVDQILAGLLFNVPNSRGPRAQRLYGERARLLRKSGRTDEEEKRLQDVRQEIRELPVAQDPDDIKAMNIIRRFADKLDEREESST